MMPRINPPLPKVVDSTIIGEWQTCQTKEYWSFQRKLGGKGASIDLIAGGAYARGLEIFRLGYYGGVTRDAEGHLVPAPDLLRNFERAFQLAAVAALEYYGDVDVPENKEKKGPDKVIMAMGAYFERFHPDRDEIQPMYDSAGIPKAEFTFAVPLPVLHPDGEPFIYAGRLDLLGVRQQVTWGLDDKTTSQLGPTWSEKWNLRGQFTGYTWILRQHYEGVAGVIARGTCFLKDKFTFAESPQQRSTWQIDQWFDNLCHVLENMKTAWAKGYYTQDFHEACAAYGGCPFQRLCLAHDAEQWVEGNYATREWDPLAKNPEKKELPPSNIIHDPLIEGLLAQEETPI